MIKITTSCDECEHADVCLYKDKSKSAMEKLKNTIYNNGSDDNCTWEQIAHHNQFNILFSCPHFRIKEAIIFKRGGDVVC